MPRLPRSLRTRRRVPRAVLVALAVVAAVAVIALIAVVGNLVTTLFQTLAARPPAVDTRIVAPDESKAAQAASAGGDATEQAAAQWLASQPTTYWLTPEIDPVDEVWDRVAHLAAEARDQDAALSIAVYGLPDRDCGNHSAGGLDPESYRAWTQRIGDALGNASDIQKIVVLEPDSIALSSTCGTPSDRAGYLKEAVDNIRGTNTWIYIDGGHSSWHPVKEMADLIRATGLLSDVRGVALNVSNYQDTAAEFDYAHALSDELGGTHAVIDTSRNGAGPAGSEWCNPAGRLVGSPGGSFGDGVVDTNLWIKPPGESDGECNGGPTAGTWWPSAAVELTRDQR